MSYLPKLWTIFPKVAKFVNTFKVIFEHQNQWKRFNIRLGDQLLLMTFFENFDFLSTLFSKNEPIFVGSVHNFVGLTMTWYSETILISNRYNGYILRT